jgi:3-methyladenine DNA glycosylase/8-oxoguanine DNA glycosylase
MTTATRARAGARGARQNVLVRVELKPAGPFRLPARGAPDGVLRSRDGVLRRLLHHEGRPVVVGAAQTAGDRVLIAAESSTREAARYGIERMRFALGVDVEVAPFLKRFGLDPAIGGSVRRRPWLRVLRRPEPFEALAWAICEQLIEYRRAAAIERRIVFELGRRVGALHDLPAPSTLAAAPPALLQSFDLGAGRAQALVRAAAEVASGRVELNGGDLEHGWRRLRAIRGIGSWTIEMLALHGQGREEQVPAGDLGLLRSVGGLLGDGDPRAFAEEAEVRSFFEPYGEWKGLAAAHLLAL